MPEFSFLTPTRTRGVRLDAIVVPTAHPSCRDEGCPTVTSVSVNDSEVRPGALFAALPGANGHGARFVEGARRNGAVAILTDRAGAEMAAASGLPTLVVDDVRRALGAVSAQVYGTGSRHPALFGVTGTNGKTTTVHLLDVLLEMLGVRSGHSSTQSRRSGGEAVASRLTSPEASELHALLARMNEDGVRAAALEVSAQALTAHRMDGLVLDVAGFTNLSHDHLDQYGSMERYLAAKVALFRPERARAGVVSLDSPAGREVAARSSIPVTTITSLPEVEADWRVSGIRLTPTRTAFALDGPDGVHVETHLPLLGRHMAADCGLALAMLATAGHDLAAAATVLAEGVPVDVPGRTALVSGIDGPRVYTDFSHTPDSTEKTLTALRAVARGPVVVLIGADGERDTSKREPMGAAAARGADVVIVTDHHSRFEDPDLIRGALLTGAREARTEAVVLDVADSSEAIRAGVRMAGPDGTVLWVGPGIVDYRIVRGVDVPYSPRVDAAHALVEAGWATPPLLAEERASELA